MQPRALDPGQVAVNAETRLNRAPLADRAQAILMQHMAPSQFKPRDFTQNAPIQQTLSTPASGMPSAEPERLAEQNYKAGDGKVSTDVLEMLKRKLTQSAGLAP